MKKRASEISCEKSAGERLREERTRLGAKQEDFAQIGGVNRNTQGAYEKDERRPDTTYLLALAQHGVDILYVVTGERVPMKQDGLTVEEADLLLNYRLMSEADRQALGRVAKALAKAAQE